MMNKIENMKTVLRCIRASDWWGRKIVPVLAIAYLQILFQGLSSERALGALAALLFSATSLAAAAHVLTDIFDVEEDRRAGKQNALEPVAHWKRSGLYFSLCLLGFVPWMFVRLDVFAAFWLAMIYAAPVLYAVPPLRLKERGFAGSLADATMAHGAPTLFVLALFASLITVPAPNTWLLTLIGGVWAWSYGLRGILLHQIFDRSNDMRAGVNTFVAQAGAAHARKIILRYFLPLEFLAFGGLLIVIFPAVPVFTLALLFFGAMDLLKVIYLWRESFDPVPAQHGTYIYPQAVYEIWFPLVAVILLAAREVGYGLLVIAHVILFHRQIAQGLHDVWQVINTGLGQLRRKVIEIVGK
jgi:hypothetical protein